MAEGRGQKRIIDRFVRYPYPSNIITNYRKTIIPIRLSLLKGNQEIKRHSTWKKNIRSSILIGWT
jgi:hypothetical protein